MEKLLRHLEYAVTLADIGTGASAAELVSEEQAFKIDGEVERHNVGQSVAIQIRGGNGIGQKDPAIDLAVMNDGHTQFTGAVAGEKCQLACIESSEQANHHVQFPVTVKVSDRKTDRYARRSEGEFWSEG